MNIVYPNCYNLDITALYLLRSLSLLHKRFAYHSICKIYIKILLINKVLTLKL